MVFCKFTQLHSMVIFHVFFFFMFFVSLPEGNQAAFLVRYALLRPGNETKQRWLGDGSILFTKDLSGVDDLYPAW